jgi:hypothetical protein
MLGSKTDVVETFKGMLARGKVPTSISELLKVSAEAPG